MRYGARLIATGYRLGGCFQVSRNSVGRSRRGAARQCMTSISIGRPVRGKRLGPAMIPPTPLVTSQDGMSESVQFRHRVPLQASLEHDAVFVQHVADGAFRALQAKHQIAV